MHFRKQIRSLRPIYENELTLITVYKLTVEGSLVTTWLFATVLCFIFVKFCVTERVHLKTAK